MSTLPELTGSEKQATWAADIRARAFEQVERLRAEVAGRNLPDAEREARKLAALDDLLAKMRSINDAKTWIDYRDTNYGLMAAQVLEVTK